MNGEPDLQTNEEVIGTTRKMHLNDGGDGLTTYVTLSWRGGKPVRLGLAASKQGTFERGMLWSLAESITIGLQHGVPLSTYAARLKGAAFDPAGVTGNPDIPMVSSLSDYLARYLAAAEPPKAA